MFEYDDEYKMYNCIINDVIIETEKNTEENETLAKVIVEQYHKELHNIIKYMMSDRKKYFENYKLEEVKELLGKPLINIDENTITYVDHKLDNEHIITVEYKQSLDKLISVSIDG